MNAELLDRPYVFAIALLIVGWLTAGAMAVRSVSRIWLRHWTERRLRGPGAAAPFEGRRGRASVDVEREALHDLLREGELEGVGEREEIAIISGVVEFGAKRVRDVMTPRADIFALDDTLDARTLAARIAQSNYSRVPIYHETLDDVRGMVLAFDVLKAGAETI